MALEPLERYRRMEMHLEKLMTLEPLGRGSAQPAESFTTSEVDLTCPWTSLGCILGNEDEEGAQRQR